MPRVYKLKARRTIDSNTVGKIFFALAILTLLAAFSLSGDAQTACSGVVMPPGTLCITQAAGNVAAQEHRELAAERDANAVLKQALLDKDKSISELQDTNRKNVADLTDRLHKTEVDLATKTGEGISKDAEIVRLTASFQFLLEHGRVKQNGLINVKF